jgi:hypothetical protein
MTSQERERICRLASLGDPDAFAELLRLRDKHPQDDTFKQAQLEGWYRLRAQAKKLAPLVENGAPPLSTRIGAFIERMGFQPPSSYQKLILDKWEQEGERQFFVNKRRTGRTTLMLLEALCDIERKNPEVVTFVSTSRIGAREMEEQLHKMADQVGVDLSNTHLKFAVSTTATTSGTVWRDHAVGESHQKRLDAMNPDNMHGAADGFGGSDY